MATAGSGAVFFLGTRAHYQVLQQPDNRYDVENGNSTETIYQNPNAQWNKMENNIMDQNYVNGSANYYCDVSIADDKDTTIKRRSKRRPSETTLCDKDDMSPAALNNVGNSTTPKEKRRSLLQFLTSLSRRKKRYNMQYLQELETALTCCSYRESCRCLECQSRYFECDEDYEDYSSDDSDYTMYVTQAMTSQAIEPDDEEPDEVFVDQVPSDNTSTDLLIEPKKSVSSESETEESMNLEVAAGTPVLLNYLLTHPVTCTIQ